MAKKRTYQDDDGRTIADMSGVEPSPMLFPRFPGRKKEQSRGPETPAQDRPWETAPQYTDEERRAAMGGALKAAMLLTGSSNINELSKKRYILTGQTEQWIRGMKRWM